MAKKLYTSVKQFEPRTLPSGYTQVEYIQSSGTQYIDTGFKPNNNTRVVIDVEVLETGVVNGIYGARDAGTTNAFVGFARTGDVEFNFTYGNKANYVTSPTGSNKGRFKIDQNKGVVTVNGTSKTLTSVSAFQCSYDMYVMGVNTTGTTNSQLDALKLYSCQIYDNGTLIRDFVPCKNASGTVGLYDMVNGTFYTNKGTGTFTAGSSALEVNRQVKKFYASMEQFEARELPSGYTQVAYIQSSGTQYINTGFKPNNNTRVVIDVDILETDVVNGLYGARDASTTNAYTGFARAGGVQFNFTYGNKANMFDSPTGSTIGRFKIDQNKGVVTVNGTSTTLTSVSAFQCSYDMYVMGVNTTGSTNSQLDALKLYSCQIYDNGTLIRDFVPCKNASGVIGLYDMVNGTFYTNKGSGAFTAGSSVQRVNKKIKKLYAAVNGVYKLIFSGGTVWKKYAAAETTVYEEKVTAERTTLGGNVTRSFTKEGYTFDASTGKFTLKNPSRGTAYASVDSSEYNRTYLITAGATGTTMYSYISATTYDWASNLTTVHFEYIHTAVATTAYSQGTYIEDVESDNPSAYPDNGRHTDGYWYVKQA